MKLPHAHYGPSRIGRRWFLLTGAQAVTIFFWSFYAVSLSEVEPRYFTHEEAHTPQWLEWSCIALGLQLAFTAWLRLPLAATVFSCTWAFLLGFPARYVAEMMYLDLRYGSWQRAYDKHSLEQDARRAAGQPER